MQVINRQPRIENLATTTFKLDVFIIENPKLLIDAINFKKPVDLAEINARSRFTVVKELILRLIFLKVIEKLMAKMNPYTISRPLKNFCLLRSYCNQHCPSQQTITRYEWLYGEERNYIYPFNFLHVSAVIGGILSLILIIYTFLFGQRRLRPWGIIQQYFIRSKILVALSRFMNNMRTAGQPESKKGVVKHTVATYVTNLQQQGTLLQPTKLMGPLGQQTSLISSTPFMLPPITNLGQQQSYAIVPPEDEIRELKTILTTQTTKIQDQRHNWKHK
ncbi:hypothetical protein BDF19DRAFT_171986 [Syncephalis fuscata]|nr:hypothetical protein BDF19DRAFT_171986 [Syncephalis fuscata]